MSRSLTFSLTLLALVAFAGNSLLCRLALKQAGIDAASFTLIRILSGAATLWAIARLRGVHGSAGTWLSGFALFVYAAAFSYAYLSLPAATGALVLFGAVQVTMIGYGLWTGERFSLRKGIGLSCAFGGLAGLLLPGITAPPLLGSALMLLAGVAWGVYSLRGKKAGDPLAATAGNFLRAAPFALATSLVTLHWSALTPSGCRYAAVSGAVASGLGYAVWYTALRGLKATTAATVQLSVPVLAAVGAVIFLGESVTLRLLAASVAILGGIALFILDRRGAGAGGAPPANPGASAISPIAKDPGEV